MPKPVPRVDVAADVRRLDARLDRGREGRHRAALRQPHHADAPAVHLRPRLQVVDAALHVPDVEGQRVDAEQRALDEVDVARIAARERVEAVATLAEDAQIGADGQEAGARHLRAVVVVVLRDVGLMLGRRADAGHRILAVWPVAVGTEDGGVAAVRPHPDRSQHLARHRHEGFAVEDDALPDQVAVHDRGFDLGVQRHAPREIAQQIEQLGQRLFAPPLPLGLRAAFEPQQPARKSRTTCSQ